MILRIDDWKFDVDLIHTMEYSSAEAAEHCDCAYCRNFYASVDRDCPTLRPMLSQFGLDVEAPDALYPYDFHKDRIWYEGEYVVFGSILHAGKMPIGHGDADGYCIIPRSESEYAYDRPHFVLSLEDAEMAWVLDEPMEAVLSPANEPSFLKKMWDRLLGKLKGDPIQS